MKLKLIVTLLVGLALPVDVVQAARSVDLVPRRVVIALERTEATRLLAGTMRSFCLEVVDQLPVGTEVALYEFGVEVSQLAHTKALTLEQARAIKDRVPMTGSKSPYVNFDLLLGELRRWNTQPTLLIVLSRGVSNPSRNHSFVDLLPALRESFPEKAGHSIFVVGLSDRIEESYKGLLSTEGIWFYRLDTKSNQPIVFLDRFLYATQPTPRQPDLFRALPSSTATSTSTPTPVPATPVPPTPIPSSTSTWVPTLTPTSTATQPPTSTSTSTSTIRPTATPTLMATPTSSATSMPTPLEVIPVAVTAPTEPPAVLPPPAPPRPSLLSSLLQKYWRGLLAGLAALAGVGLLIGWYLKSLHATARSLLDEERAAEGVRVISLVGTNPEGREIHNQQVVVQDQDCVLKIGPRPSSNVYLPEASHSVALRIHTDGSVSIRRGLFWSDIGHGEPIDLGGITLVTSLDILEQEDLDHAA